MEEKQPKRTIILSLGGSFNPIHKNHIDIMVKAKEWLEENTDFKVVSGILVVTTDNYLKNKFGRTSEKILTAEHRMALCKLSCGPHEEWLAVHPVPCVSAYRAGLTYWNNDNTMHVGLVMGADKYDLYQVRSRWRQQAIDSVRVDVILGRGDVTDRMNADFQEDLQSGLMLNSNYFIISDNVGDLSSTYVRQVLDMIGSDESEQGKEKLSGMMSLPLAEYLFEHRNHLYIQKEEEETNTKNYPIDQNVKKSKCSIS